MTWHKAQEELSACSKNGKSFRCIKNDKFESPAQIGEILILQVYKIETLRPSKEQLCICCETSISKNAGREVTRPAFFMGN